MADVIYSGGTTDEQVVVSTSNGAERGIKTLAVSGDILYSGGATDTQVVVQTDNGAERAQKVFDLNGGGGSGGSAAWGNIEGTLSDQTDLQTALNSKIQNTATGTQSLTIYGTATNAAQGINIGYFSETVNGSVALGSSAKATGFRAVQLGNGTNSVSDSLQFKGYQLLDANGKIPSARLPALSNITDNDKLFITSIVAPSNSYVALTPTNNGTYTAPADGWFVLNGITTRDADAFLFLSNNEETRYTSPRMAANTISIANCILGISLPVKAGDVVGLLFSALNFSYQNYTNLGLRFYYLEGNKPAVGS